MNTNEQQLRETPPGARVLLLPHCLRRVETCRASYSPWGLECRRCNPACPVNLLRQAALDAGYGGVCVAPGGSLALKYVAARLPRAIVAVACDQELREGIDALNGNGHGALLPIVVVPLTKDGCVNTEVDIEMALLKIRLGIQSGGPSLQKK